MYRSDRISSKLEDEIIEIITNKEFKLKFKQGYQAFWPQKQMILLPYTGLSVVVEKKNIAFPTSYYWV